MIRFELPIYWVKSFKTKPDKVTLAGMNWFRNAHYFDQNKFKKDFESMIAKQLKDAVVNEIEQFTMEYRLYYKNPNSDPSNIIALIEKVSLDALQELGYIKNDNMKYHYGSSWRVIQVDKERPRCSINLRKWK